MKKLICINDIKNCAAKGQKTMYIDGSTIITPAARDAAAELGVSFTHECPRIEKVEAAACKTDNSNLDMELIYRIVREIVGQTAPIKEENSFDKECDAGGLRLIRGNTVACDKFETGNPQAKVGLKDIVSTKESPNMGAGFMTIEKSSFDWELNYEEFDYIVEGSLDITINGKTYKGKQGDVFYIPKNSKITWSTKDYAKFFYVTFPANWAELASANQ